MLEYKDLLVIGLVSRFNNKVDSADDENEVCLAGGKSTLISFIFLSLMVEQRTVLLAWLRLEHEIMCL